MDLEPERVAYLWINKLADSLRSFWAFAVGIARKTVFWVSTTSRIKSLFQHVGRTHTPMSASQSLQHPSFSLAHLRLIVMLKRQETQHLWKCKWCFWPCCSSLLQLCTWGPFQGPPTTVTFSSLTRSSCSGLILPTTLPSLSIDLNTLVTIQSFQWLTPRSKKFYVSSFQTYVLDPSYLTYSTMVYLNLD